MIAVFIILVFVAGLMFSLLRFIFKHVLRRGLRFIIHMIMGFLTMLLLNVVVFFLGYWGDFTALLPPLNYVNIAVSGIFGIPGVVFLVILQLFFV